ncbi:helix-turn-helix domain-containing protein [Rickettsiales endosymbiont of Trichoplax sp. H2]|uniref:helix-turn-helix domain-containing protein n=1 Tax=Rickettsiales endosymbiont of Trichoplax sp. H2 TaxID=2021221 RepID=UPI0012B2C155|nr:helix-turn-helix transcriptional regulator [Rickettsiales endosymbiont of Trichoplax sp. H2]MSO14464.1 hypothetical protein [Rickettsiales endosymbiont of Trichoplax sp. H2]
MSIINKKFVARNLKFFMAKNEINIPSLASNAGLSRYLIENVLYARACKKEVLEKISNALNIDINDLIIENIEDKKYRDFNISIYSEITRSVESVTKKYNIAINKACMEGIIYSLYTNYKDIKNLDEAVKGIVLYLYNNNKNMS